MQLFGLSTKKLLHKNNIVNEILNAIDKRNLKMDEGDVVAITSKVLAIIQDRIKKLDSVRPSREAGKIAETYDLDPNFVEIVLQEAEKVYGGVPKALLTLKDHVLIANAGVDQKNSPKGFVALWPKLPHKSAEKIRKELYAKTGKRVGVLIVDSRVTPLRMGTIGIAIGIAGFEPLKDYRNEIDLYGKSIAITRQALADDLASAAHLIMGESNERVPAVLIKNAPVKLADKVKPSSVLISAEHCLFMNQMHKKLSKSFAEQIFVF